MDTFYVWCPDLGETQDDAKTYRAFDSEDAACKWAEHHDMHDDGSIFAGDCKNVCVLIEGRKVPELMTVGGELVPRYSARAAK